MENTKMNEIVEGTTSKKGLGIAIGLGVAGLAAVGAIVTKKLLNRNVQEADQDWEVHEVEIKDDKKSKTK
jgi:hypothetical protein